MVEHFYRKRACASIVLLSTGIASPMNHDLSLLILLYGGYNVSGYIRPLYFRPTNHDLSLAPPHRA